MGTERDGRDRILVNDLLLRGIVGIKPEERVKAQDILSQLKNGADFATLAQEHSTEKRSADKGGDLGLFEAWEMEKPFSKAAFALQVDQISDIVNTSVGLHIIKVTEIHPAQSKTFNEVKSDIVAHLTERKKLAIRKKYVRTLRKAAKIEYQKDI